MRLTGTRNKVAWPILSTSSQNCQPTPQDSKGTEQAWSLAHDLDLWWQHAEVKADESGEDGMTYKINLGFYWPLRRKSDEVRGMHKSPWQNVVNHRWKTTWMGTCEVVW
jgi:hypothetical protein